MAKCIKLAKGEQSVLVEDGSVMHKRWRDKGFKPVEAAPRVLDASKAEESKDRDPPRDARTDPEQLTSEQLVEALKTVGVDVPKSTAKARLVELYRSKVTDK